MQRRVFFQPHSLARQTACEIPAAYTYVTNAHASVEGPVRKLCEFCQVAKESDLQRPVAMDRNGQAYYAARSQ
jgi:hypothetical protein